MYVLGINAYDHDVAACLLRDGQPVAAIEKERLTRVKHDTGFCREVVEYCLDAAGIGLDDVDLIVRNSYVLPVPDLETRLVQQHWAHHLTASERKVALESPLFLPDDDRFVTCSHHLAHAYSAFAASPFEEGAVMVVDGVGSFREDVVETLPDDDGVHARAREAESTYVFHGADLEVVDKVFMDPPRGFFADDFYAMAGLGAVYSRVSTYVFGNWNHCGEVMGLAPFGDLPEARLAWLEGDALQVPDWGADLDRPWLGRGDAAWNKHPDRPHWEALARRVQEDTELVLIERARRLHEQTGATNLCLAGGVALNCVANGRIIRETPFENVFIQPAAGDDGIAIGCALYGHLAHKQGTRTWTMTHAYLGRSYPDADADAAVKGAAVSLAAKRSKPDDVVEATADLLAKGRIVGWFQGASEFGPRALGNRSILADPRSEATKDRVNAKVKHRQSFRPFAPVVLAERASEFFEGEEESPFMLVVKRVLPEAKRHLGAIMHVDGTARVQTLRREANPRLYALIEAFERRTGVPVLLNTSFNDRGEPIVETPRDAVTSFLGTKLDALVLHDHVLEKRHLHGGLYPLYRRLARMRRALSSDRFLEVVVENVLDR